MALFLFNIVVPVEKYRTCGLQINEEITVQSVEKQKGVLQCTDIFLLSNGLHIELSKVQ